MPAHWNDDVEFAHRDAVRDCALDNGARRFSSQLKVGVQRCIAWPVEEADVPAHEQWEAEEALGSLLNLQRIPSFTSRYCHPPE